MPVIIKASFLSSKNNAVPTSKTDQKKPIINLVFFPKLILKSIILDELNELIEELKVDIAAESTPEINNPFIAIGRSLIIKYANSLSFSNTIFLVE